MKQEIPAQNLRPELPPIRYDYNPESIPRLSGGETDSKDYAERYNQKGESVAEISEVILSTALPTPVVSTALVDDVTTVTNNPVVAGDDDLIEKAWVEKAKKIVADTRDNPHKRDDEVNSLQVDYLKKRYGRKLGVTE